MTHLLTADDPRKDLLSSAVLADALDALGYRTSALPHDVRPLRAEWKVFGRVSRYYTDDLAGNPTPLATTRLYVPTGSVRGAWQGAGDATWAVNSRTVVDMHGDWHDGSCWSPLVDELVVRGHEAVAPDMPYGDRQGGIHRQRE